MPDIDLQKMLHQEHQRSKDSRAADGFKDESFLPHAMIIAHDGSITVMALAIPREMAGMAMLQQARKDKAIAVIFSSDARIISLDRYAAHYGITAEEAIEHRNKNLREVGGDYGNLPKEVWEDCMITWIKGPDMENKQISTSYTEGPNDTVVFDEPREDAGHVVIKTLPNWW